MDKILHFEGGGLEVEQTSDSDAGIFALIVLVIGGGVVINKLVTPFLIELRMAYNDLILTLTNNFVLILILIFILVPLLILIYHRIVKSVYERKARQEEKDRIYDEKDDKRRKLLEIKEGIDDARRHKNNETERKLLREQYFMEKDVESLVNLEVPYYLLERKKAEERESNSGENEEKEKVSVNVDLDNPYYKRKDLNKNEIEFLLAEGYHAIIYRSICTDKKENFIVKPRFNESLIHFVVIYDLAEYLKSKDIDYHLFTTKMPDIIFKLNGKRIALEVETGTVMSNMKKFREKVDSLNQNYGENWYFIVTNRNKVRKYKKYGKVIDLRYLKKKLDKIIEKR